MAASEGRGRDGREDGLAKELTQKSLIEIGYAFGGIDHATVLYAVKKITKERAQNQELNHTLHLIEQDLKNWN